LEGLYRRFQNEYLYFLSLLSSQISRSSWLLGVYGECGYQIFAAHYSLGPALEIDYCPVFLNLRAGYLHYRGLAPNLFLGRATSFSYHGGAASLSIGYEWKFKKGGRAQGLRIFSGISPARMWVREHDHWEWETSWAVHLGIGTSVLTDPVWKEISGNVYEIGWLDTDFVIHKPVKHFTLMTLGEGANLWLFRRSLGSPDPDQEKEPQEVQP